MRKYPPDLDTRKVLSLRAMFIRPFFDVQWGIQVWKGQKEEEDEKRTASPTVKIDPGTSRSQDESDTNHTEPSSSYSTFLRW